MSKKWEKFSEEELRQFVADSYSFAQLAEKCGYTKTSGSYLTTMQQMVEQYGFDISHFKGQSWNKDNFDYSRFQANHKLKTGSTLSALIHLRGHQCECCHLTEWNNQPIPLEVHHVDGDNTNNTLENVKLFCPNCHALTENWRGRNINRKMKEIISDEQFVEALKTSPNIRQALLKLGLSAKGGNYYRANELITKYQITHLLRATS